MEFSTTTHTIVLVEIDIHCACDTVVLNSDNCPSPDSVKTYGEGPLLRVVSKIMNRMHTDKQQIYIPALAAIGRTALRATEANIIG